MIDDVLRQNWSTLHGLSLESPALHFAKTAPIRAKLLECQKAGLRKKRLRCAVAGCTKLTRMQS